MHELVPCELHRPPTSQSSQRHMCVQLRLLVYARLLKEIFLTCQYLSPDPLITKHPPSWLCGVRVHGEQGSNATMTAGS